MLTIQQLLEVMPHLPSAKAATYLPYLNEALEESGIITKRRVAAFLAQVAHESNELRWFEELPHRRKVAGCRLCQDLGTHAAGVQYEGRADLGNTEAGDGRRYKGRGPIQLTGRTNYRLCGRDLGIDLENNPVLAAQPEVGFRCAAWYWGFKGLNELADEGDFDSITRAINGGLNGKPERDRYHAKALGILTANGFA